MSASLSARSTVALAEDDDDDKEEEEAVILKGARELLHSQHVFPT